MLLPESMVEVEDFLHPGGRMSLFQKEVPSVHPESSLFSLFWWSSDTQTSSSCSLTSSEVKARKVALKCIQHTNTKTIMNSCLRWCSPQATTEGVQFPGHHMRWCSPQATTQDGAVPRPPQEVVQSPGHHKR
ncbi:hypothetical protein EMCRGX_G006512 [Ephydatia muelleri]